MLRPKWGPGRPPKFTHEQRKALVDLALSRPRDLGLPYAQWSLSRLRQQAVQRGLVPSISEEWLRGILREDEVSHPSIRTWKTFPDPQFEEKKGKIDRWTRNATTRWSSSRRTRSAGSSGSPARRRGGFPHQRPGRTPAEFNRKFGPVYSFLTRNVFRQRLFGGVDRTKHAATWLAYRKDVRAEYPTDLWVNLIWDGASNHWTAPIRPWARANKVRRFSMSTHASHLNPVERHAGDLQMLAIAGETYTTPEAVGRALGLAVRYRNEERQARGKRFRDTVRKDHRRRTKMPIWRRSR